MNAADLIIGGINELGVAIPFHYNAKDDIAEELTNLIMANGNHEQAKQVKSTRRNTLVDAMNLSKQKIRVVRDLLKLVFGYEFSELWTIVGFKDKLLLPEDIEDMKAILQAMNLYFINNPAQEMPALGATAVQIKALLDSLIAAQQALVSQEATVKELMDVRDEKYEIVRKRISSVYRELGNHLEPLDRRWLKFGFVMPGADETPEMPTELKATLIGPTAVALKWVAAQRAVYYRVYKKVTGVDQDYVAVGSPADLDFTIEGLPAGATVEIQITAVNTGGESSRTEAVTVVMHS